jgi:hypothetical protein
MFEPAVLDFVLTVSIAILILTILSSSSIKWLNEPLYEYHNP